MAKHQRRPGESIAAERSRLANKGRTTSAGKRATGRGRVSPTRKTPVKRGRFRR